jgi:parallel beta-helix repeat protein
MNYKSFVLLMIFAVFICISAMGSASAANSPSANFTSNTTNGSTPLSVQFNDTSKGSPTSWLWNFGDGKTSTKQNPVHNYTKNGNYSVSLTVTNVAGSDSLTKSNYITVLPTVNTSPTGGTYKTAQKVELTCSDTTATIYYANDTTDPRTSSTRTKYSGTITISKTTTLRYAALDTNGNWSPLYIQNYVIGSSGTGGTGGLDDTTWAKSGGDLNNTGLSNYNGPETNTALWNYTTGKSISGHCSPVIGSDGTIYIGSDDGKFYAFNVDGTVKWTYTTGNSIGGSTIGADGTIYTLSGPYIFALNHNGTLQWKYKTPGSLVGTPTIVSDGTIYFGSTDGKLYALYHNGTLKWTYDTGTYVYSREGGPAIGSDGTIYFESGESYSNYGKLYAINPDGTLKWKYTIGGSLQGSPAVGSDGTIYAGGVDGNLYAINPNGTLKWNYSTGETIYSPIISSPAVGADRTVYFGSQSGNFYAVTDNGNSGTLKWEYTTGGAICSMATISANGIIYVGSSDGKLYAFNVDGTLLWTYTTGSGIYGSVAIGANETLYFGSYDKNMYAIANTVLRANQTEGSAPLTVQFTGSGVSPVSWNWDFGDGTTSTEQNPVHKYANAGYYTVTLTVTSSNGQTRTVRFTQYIKAYNPPVSNFTVSTIWGTAPTVVPPACNQIQFKDTSSNVPTSWYWDFGDGTNSTEQNPTHVYATMGTYLVQLTVTNAAGTSTYSTILLVRSTILVNSSLASGTYNNTQTVKLTSEDSKATIYYTNDTTDPRTNSTRIKYTGPITISKTTTLRYAAVTTTGKWSALYLQNFVIGTGGLLTNSSNPTYQGDNNNTGLSNYTGPQTNNTKWNNSEINPSADTSIATGSDGTIYAGSNGYLYALAPTGIIKWRYYTGSSSWVSTPTIGKDGTIYISASSYLHALKTDGTLIWKIYIYSSDQVSPSVGADGTIYIPCYDNSGFLDPALYAINPNGTIKWNASLVNASFIKGNLAIASDGTIYVPGHSFLYAVNPDGTIKWSYAFGNHQYSSPSIGTDGTIYILAYGGALSGEPALYAINPDGTLKWRYTTKRASYGAVALGSDGIIYLLDSGTLIALTPDGTQKWNYTAGTSSLSSPVIDANGTLYFTAGSSIFAVNSNGILKWNYTDHSAVSNPVIDSDGTLYVGINNNLQAFRDAAAKFNYTIDSNPLHVQFNDTSNNATSWKWNFGDGTTSTKQNPTHTYSKSGQYKVTLVATLANGETLTAAQVLTISDITPPTVTISPNGGKFNTTQTVTLNSSDDSNKLTVYYTTDGSDPQTSSIKHVYTSSITLNSTTTLKYAAVDSSGNWSPVYEETYTISETAVNTNINVTSGMTNAEIQSIIDNAASGSTIEFIGSLYENLQLTINKQLNIISNVGTKITTSSTLPVFTINGTQAAGTTIKGFTIVNTGTGPGILIKNTSNVTISNDQISSTSGTAVQINGSSNTTIRSSTVSDSTIGIDISDSNGTQINQSNINNNGNGIIIENSTNTSANNSQITGNTKNGISVKNSNKTTISGNTIKKNGNTTTSGSGVYFENSTNVTVTNNQINENYYGITALNLTNAIIKNNTFINNDRDGILLNGTTKNVTIASNAMQENDNGIHVNCASENLNISGNLITGNIKKITKQQMYHGNGILLGENYAPSSTFHIEHNVMLKNANMDFRSCMAAGDYIPGSNLFGSGCKQVTYDPQITMEMVKTGKNQFSVVFRDGNTGEIVTDLPSFAVTFKNGPYSVTAMTINGVATAVFTNLANGDVVGTAYGLTVSTAYSSIINYLFGNPDDPGSGGNDDPGSGGNSGNNGTGSGNEGDGPGSGSGNNPGTSSNSGTSGSSSSNGASSGSSASVGLATAAADAGSSGNSGQAGSNGQQSGQSKTAQELFIDDTTKNTPFWGILGVIVLIVVIFGGYYRKDLMSMIRKSKK